MPFLPFFIACLTFLLASKVLAAEPTKRKKKTSRQREIISPAAFLSANCEEWFGDLTESHHNLRRKGKSKLHARVITGWRVILLAGAIIRVYFSECLVDNSGSSDSLFDESLSYPSDSIQMRHSRNKA